MISDFFIWCSGANKDILKECPTERTKFIGIGATILLTAILASISGGYAIYFTFNSYIISIVMGMFWGVVIFNLDRYIVSSIRKAGNFRQEFLMALPRIGIALVLAITISKPLETKLFDATINKKMSKTEDKYNADCEKDFNARRDTLDIKKRLLEEQLKTAKMNIYNNDPIIKDYDNLKSENANETKDIQDKINANVEIIEKNSWIANGKINPRTGRPRKIKKYNEVAKQKMAENRQLNAEIETNSDNSSMLEDSSSNRRAALTAQVNKTEKEYNDQIAGVQRQIDDLNGQRSDIIAKCKKDAGGNKDILDRLSALGQLKSFGNTVWFASWLITLIFVLLETAPITVKLLSHRGPYDEILDSIEGKIADDEKKKKLGREAELENLKTEVKDVNERKKTFRLNIEQEKLDIELKANKDLLTSIAAKQVKLTEEIVDNWYKDQHTKFKANTTGLKSSFIDKLWRTVNTANEVIYMFKNGESGKNELIYIINGKYDKGTWEYYSNGEVLLVELAGIKKEYQIVELSPDSMKLGSQADNIELQTV